MTGETEGGSALLGTARVDVIVDTASWDAAIQRGETRLSQMTQAAQDEYNKLNTAEKRRVDTLLKQADTIGYTREQQILYNAALKGVPTNLLDELKNKLAASAAETRNAARDAKGLGDALNAASFSDTQLYKGNQALADFRRRSDEARQAQLALAASAEEAARRVSDAQLKAASLSPAQLYRANQGVDDFQAQAAARRQADTIMASSDAAEQARIRQMVQASLERVDAEAKVIAAQQRSVEMTDAQREAVERIKGSQTSQAQIAERGQRILDAEAKSRQQATAATKGESDELRKLLGQIDPTTAAYERLDRMEAQLRAHRKAGAISQDDFDGYAAKIGKARDAVGGADEALSHFSLTSGVARREIGTLIGELARGDVHNFQSSLITLANNTGLLSTLLSPTAVGAAAFAASLAAVAVAAADAYEAEQRVNEAIAVSGNFAGVTSGSFEKLASGISTANGHLGEAREILAGLVTSGRVGADALESVGQAGYDIAILTKKGAEEATQAALQMFDGTVTGALKANEQYHFLSEATYEQIKALEEEGRQQDIVRVTAEAFHDSVQPRIQLMTDQVYGLAKAWEQAKHGTESWYETFKNGASLLLGTASLDTQIAALQGRQQAAQNRQYSTVGEIRSLFFGSGLVDKAESSFEQFGPDDQKKLADLVAQRDKIVADAEAQSRQQADTQASISADQRIDRMSDQVDKAHQLSAAIKSLNADFETLWSKSSDNKRLAGVERIVGKDGSVSFAGGQYDSLRADLEKKYADASGAKLDSAQAAAQLAAFKSSLSQYGEAYANAQRELDAQRKAGSISEAEYYDRSRAEVWKTEQEQVDAIQAEINVLQARKVAGADKARNDSQVAELQDQLRKAEQTALSKTNVLTEQEAGEKTKATAAINAYIAALGQQTAARQAEIDLQVLAVGMGDKEFSQLQRLNKIRQDAADQQVKLTKQLNTVGADGIDQNTYDTKVAELKKATDARVAAELDGQARIDAAQADWRNGGYRALDQFRDQAADSAGTFGSFIQTTYGGLTDFIDNASSKGLGGVKTLVSGVLKEVSRLYANKAAASLLSYGLSYVLGTPQAVSSADNSAALSQSANNAISGYRGNINFNALGGVYDSPDLSKFSGGVYNQPQFFAFAKGAGVFAEAGPEAIMPLTHTADGKLGVRSVGSGGGEINIPVSVTVYADGSGDVSTSGGEYEALAKQLGENMQAISRQTLADAMRPGGMLWRGRGS